MTIISRSAAAVTFALCLAATGGCAALDGGEDEVIGPELQPGGLLGKADSAGVAGLPVETADLDTQVWTVKNQWEDRYTMAAMASGPAWSMMSGLTWDQKYSAWIDSLEKTPGYQTYYDTFYLMTPWGKKMPAPKLECAETAMFLRATFASWYNLPFYMEAYDDNGGRVFFGHFGIRNKNGRYQNMPLYASAYKDYTDEYGSRSGDDLVANWPKDAKLRSKKLLKSNENGDNDLQPFIAPDAHVGAYFDEIFLNKRAGYFIIMLLEYFGSVNLTDSRNTYNLLPQAIRAGDVLLERWQAKGIGHTLVTKKVAQLPDGKTMAELVSGSMPRRLGMWVDAYTSKGYYTNEYMGGEGATTEGIPYVKLGGGLKRFRVAKDVKGSWTNSWMSADEASWISDDNWDRLKTRPKEFDALLGEPPVEEQRESLLRQIEDARKHLRNYPASCSARENRERAFSKLYSLSSRAWQEYGEAVDKKYRNVEDYVFAELEYTKAKTCCWNSSNGAMYQIIMDYVNSVRGAGQACVEPPVFKAQGGGYQVFKDFAASTGRAAQWKDWSEDEPCDQRAVVDDEEKYHDATPWCTVIAPPPPEPTPEPQPEPTPP